MSKKRKRKVYNFGDVVTTRLSPDSNCTQEVLDWINAEDRILSRDIIEAIQFKIALDNKLSDNAIKEIAFEQMTKTKIIENVEDDKSLYPGANIVHKTKAIQEENQQSDKIIEDTTDYNDNVVQDTMNVEDEIFGSGISREEEPGKKVMSALRAMRSIQRQRG